MGRYCGASAWVLDIAEPGGDVHNRMLHNWPNEDPRASLRSAGRRLSDEAEFRHLIGEMVERRAGA